MRDILLIADESGSVGWVNFEKIKTSFKVVYILYATLYRRGSKIAKVK